MPLYAYMILYVHLLKVISGDFHKWWYPNSLVGLFHGKNHLEMDDFGVPPLFGLPPY